MFNSDLARRLVMIVLGALLLSALLTVGIYVFAARQVFTRMKTNELMEHAERIAATTAEFQYGEFSEEQYEGYMQSTPEMLNANVSVYLYREPASEAHYMVPDKTFTRSWRNDASAAIERRRFSIMDRKSLSFTEPLSEEQIETLFIGYPIVITDPQRDQSQAVGAVYITIDLEEISESYTSLTFALVLASSTAFLVMIWPLLVVIRKITRPLQQTTEVAIAMNRGDFSVRADSSGPGEIGELSRAINNLASDLDRTLSSLMLERNRLQQVIDGLNEGLAAVSAELNITHFNPSLVELMLPHSQSELTETEQETALRRTFADLGIWSDFIQVMNQRSPYSRRIEKDQMVLQISLTHLSTHAGRVAGAVALFRDVTESERLEQTRRDYVANVSHELRTPLTAVRALVEPLNDGLVTQDDDRRRYYKIILEETMRLSRLISDMLELSRLQAGTADLRQSRFSLSWILDSLEDKYQPMAEQRGIDLIFPENDSSMSQIEVDWNADRLEQILIILIDNALKFTEEGGEIRVQVDPDARPDKVLITVKDDGSGIDPDDVDHVFERFYKADKSREKREGTGLGLSIANEILKLSGETIWVVSKPGGGAAFTFTMPLAADETVVGQELQSRMNNNGT